MKEIAIIGPTACGKSAAAFELAREHNGIIVSLDSLSIYREIDIASAKPPKAQREEIIHFGIDILRPDETFNVMRFMDEYERAKKYALEKEKNMIIVGGSSFYLKAMCDGITDMPTISEDARQRARSAVHEDIESAYELLRHIDQTYAQSIAANDTYRISRGLELFFHFKTTPTEIFSFYPKRKIDADMTLYEIFLERDVLRERIKLRTAEMFSHGLLDEARRLSREYPNGAKPFSSIGLKECFAFLRNEIGREACEEHIVIHTAQLAKRQTTFNKTQFATKTVGSVEEIMRLARAGFSI